MSPGNNWKFLCSKAEGHPGPLSQVGSGSCLIGPCSRTAPYGEPTWRPRLMHDGASLKPRDAILRHRGEASHVSEQFEKLKREDQEAIIEFLKSL